MRNIFFLIFIALLLLPEWVWTQEEVPPYLGIWEKKYSGLKDYTVDVKVRFDMEGFKIPEMVAKIYYKIPDKIKVESKKIFFFPKEGGFFNPGLFKQEAFEVRLLERILYDRRKAVRLKLFPKDTKKMIPSFVLIMDTERNLIREINISSSDGREVKALLDYNNNDSFDLPSRIEVQLELPFNESIEVKDLGQASPQRSKPITGKIEVTYLNYKVNSGLRDDIFKEATSPIPRGWPQK